MDLELKGKVAIVTGGSRGIGKAIGRELAKEGANVALVGARSGRAWSRRRRSLRERAAAR